jgi:hypothetical protein
MDKSDRYCHGDIECIDAIRSALTPEEFRGFCKGNVLKYTWREQHKGMDDDLEKAMDYLTWAVEDDRPDLGKTDAELAAENAELIDLVGKLWRGLDKVWCADHDQYGCEEQCKLKEDGECLAVHAIDVLEKFGIDATSMLLGL